ncbi:roadblock/LC7 domain-containing protein [Streptomyces violaceusniger]|uniref:Roadblock/LC7 family protein n=1 Tax=Streptomyces violaceusniger (strain Tu 4113) TaxID=653045 RepID=G2PH10_STRV4|nr:Roadblock/LC7 family protein [Streptomyces violaceusniger Tu 4113]
MEDVLMSPPLDQLARTPGALHALLLSADGGSLSSSDGIATHTAERVAAALSSIQAASRHASALCSAEGSSWKQTSIQFEDTCLYLFAAGSHAYIAVAVTRDADMSLIAENTAIALKQLRCHQVKWPHELDTPFFNPQRFPARRSVGTPCSA